MNGYCPPTGGEETRHIRVAGDFSILRRCKMAAEDSADACRLEPPLFCLFWKSESRLTARNSANIDFLPEVTLPV